jgi:hypothetical protein
MICKRTLIQPKMMMKAADLPFKHPSRSRKRDRLGAFFSTICWPTFRLSRTDYKIRQSSPVLPHLPSTSHLNLFLFPGPKIFILSQILCLEEKVSKNLPVKIRHNWTQVLSFGAVFFTSEIFLPLNLHSFSKNIKTSKYTKKTGLGFFNNL